jgi:hypothetical protein
MPDASGGRGGVGVCLFCACPAPIGAKGARDIIMGQPVSRQNSVTAEAAGSFCMELKRSNSLRKTLIVSQLSSRYDVCMCAALATWYRS